MHNNKYYQKCITFGRANEGLRADFQKQLIEMQKDIGFEYVRFHGIFHDDMAVYKEIDDKPQLWFGYIDKLFDFLLDNRLKPLLELGFVPTELATVPNTVFWW
ncbi:MAG: beta-xylosidase, partial [Clostridia bacterium]|nr:beta-xylosidase [Clostridia bacterium]